MAMAGAAYYKESGDFDDAAENFESGEKAEKSKKDNATYTKAMASRNKLKQNEDGASKNKNDKSKTLGEKENSVFSDKKGKKEEEEEDDSKAGRMKSAVKGLNAVKMGKLKDAKSNFRKAGPGMVVLLILMLCIGGSFIGQMALPFSLMSRLTNTFDSMETTHSLRSRIFLRYQTNQSDKSCIKSYIFRKDKFKPSSRQVKALAKNGITFEDSGSGGKVMKYNGKTVVADASQAGDGKIFFNDMYEQDNGFRNAYDESYEKWSSKRSWFSKIMNKFLKKDGIKSRNTFEEDGYRAGDKDAGVKAREHISEAASDIETKVTARETEEKQEEESSSTDADESGEESKPTKQGDYRDTVETEADGTAKVNESETGTISAKSKKKVSEVRQTISGTINKVIGGASKVVNIYCAISDTIGALTAIIAAMQALQLLKIAATVFEGIQSGQAGNSNAPTTHILESLTKPEKDKWEDVREVTVSGSTEDKSKRKTTVTERKRSAMESEGIKATYEERAANPSDPSIKSMNYNTVSKNMFTSLTGDSKNGLLSILAGVADKIDVSVSAFRSCAIARIYTAYASIGATIISCLLTFCIKDFIEKGVMQLIKGALRSFLTSVIVAIAVPFIVKLLSRKVITQVAGEDMGNALFLGANSYMGGRHQFTGGAVASKDSLAMYYQAQDKVLADKARYERETRSPFDITSEHTFLGSLATKMIPIASQMTSVTSAFNGVSTVVGNAFKSLTPRSSAVSAGIKAQSEADYTKKYCPNLDDIGAVGDAGCNPYIITDVSTISKHPADVVNKVDSLSEQSSSFSMPVSMNVSDIAQAAAEGQSKEWQNLKDVEDEEADNEPIIGKKSKLAKYIYYCGQRSSPFGLADQNIAAEVDSTQGGSNNVGDKIASSVIGATPVVGDIVDILSNKSKVKNMGWISGESCVVGNTAKEKQGATESINWGEAKEYQRFIEDQQLAEAEGLIEESPVSKLIAEYYEEHPIDYSYEGMLARYSGLTKDNVIATLNVIKLAEFAFEYNPVAMYPTPRIENDDESMIELDIDYSPLARLFNEEKRSMTDIVYDSRRRQNITA